MTAVLLRIQRDANGWWVKEAALRPLPFDSHAQAVAYTIERVATLRLSGVEVDIDFQGSAEMGRSEA